jgi:hypothetical protein
MAAERREYVMPSEGSETPNDLLDLMSEFVVFHRVRALIGDDCDILRNGAIRARATNREGSKCSDRERFKFMIG